MNDIDRLRKLVHQQQRYEEEVIADERLRLGIKEVTRRWNSQRSVEVNAIRDADPEDLLWARHEEADL